MAGRAADALDGDATSLDGGAVELIARIGRRLARGGESRAAQRHRQDNARRCADLDPKSVPPHLIGNLCKPAWFPCTVAFSTRNLRKALVVVALSTAGCADLSPRETALETSGKVIALSGGDAGARGACVTCHGLNGEGDGHLVPRIAGLDAGYFSRQMEFYAKGLRRNEQMSWIARRMDGPAREKLGRYYAALPVPAAALATRPSCVAVKLYHQGDPARGLQACAACHGEDGRGNAGNPAVADQPPAYLAEQFRQWRAGERTGDPQRIMTQISHALTDAERNALADYNPARRDATRSPRSPEACL